MEASFEALHSIRQQDNYVICLVLMQHMTKTLLTGTIIINSQQKQEGQVTLRLPRSAEICLQFPIYVFMGT